VIVVERAPVRCYAPGVLRLVAISVLLLVAACEAERPRLVARHVDRPAPIAPTLEPSPAPIPDVVPTPAPIAPPTTPPSRDGWNEAQIHWESYADGLARARRESRPVLLVMSATWCGHCRTYSHVFEDARVVERAQRFVMVHVDQDAERDIAARYVLDGQYVPRTYFLGPDGGPMAVTATNPRFRYFYDEHDPASLVAGMDAALAAAGG
jgi:thiol-disulfide isomerase/thioredoxin